MTYALPYVPAHFLDEVQCLCVVAHYHDALPCLQGTERLCVGGRRGGQGCG